MKCYNCCKSDTFRMWSGPLTLLGVEVVAHGKRCSACGVILFDASEVDRQEREVAAGIVARGIRTGIEFKFVRKMADLRATDVADLLDVRPETVSRWETGALELPKLARFAPRRVV